MDKDVVNEPLLDKVEVSDGEVKERLDGWFLMCCLSLNGLTRWCLVTQTAVAATLDLNGPALSNRGHLAFVQSVGK